ncbi:hypothetical protein CD934_08950 [Streptomyces calvus]|uniref:Uncharacterized protein n=1 Tax=Streptomyces calvus TaxID=67282 RepID=A0A514JPS8_9ACTN|nr:hypothetical protein [Streptomyces calvus]QDI68798.1 hypothetical protein CD934_08950 [Streptomyces calvus]
MDGTAILFILAVAGVASICLFTTKGLLDQVPDVIRSAGQVRDEWERFKKKHDEAPKPDDEEPPPPVTVPADDEEPPAAA